MAGTYGTFKRSGIPIKIDGEERN